MSLRITEIEEVRPDNIVKVLAQLKKVLAERDEYISIAVDIMRDTRPELTVVGVYEEVAKRVGVSTATVRRALTRRFL